jgi:hypothetical protein
VGCLRCPDWQGNELPTQEANEEETAMDVHCCGQEYTIRSILETYELPDKLREKLAWIATTRLAERFVNTFDDQYAYIAHLVDVFTRHHCDRYIKSLDARISSDKSRTYHEVIGVSDALCQEEPDQDYGKNESRIAETIAILRRNLEDAHFDFVVHLIRATRPRCIATDPVGVSENIEAVRARLRELAAKYQANGKIVMPKRPIGRIRFTPLSIQFKKRNYAGNPLGFFSQHIDLYDGMSRARLCRFDPGLYGALCRANQIHAAIP